MIINQHTHLPPCCLPPRGKCNFIGWSTVTLRAPSIPPVDDKTAKRRPAADVFKRPQLAPRKAKTIRSAFSAPLWQANSQSVIQSNNPISSCRFCSGFSRNLLIFSDDFQLRLAFSFQATTMTTMEENWEMVMLHHFPLATTTLLKLEKDTRWAAVDCRELCLRWTPIVPDFGVFCYVLWKIVCPRSVVWLLSRSFHVALWFVRWVCWGRVHFCSRETLIDV